MDDARALLALSDLDLALVRAEKTLDDLPEKQAIIDLRKRMRDFEAVRAKAQQYVDDARRILAKDEDETASLDAKIDAEQAKILSGEVTNPKEVQNLSRELDALKRRKDKLENTTIGVMEKLETGLAQVAKVDQAIQAASVKERDLVEAYKTRGGEVQHEIATMRAKRSALAAALPAPLLERYQAACATKHGIGVGVLRNGACSACRVQLPSERVQALESGPDIAQCPECKRVMIVRMGGAAQ